MNEHVGTHVGITLPGLSRPIAVTQQALVLAQRLHDAYERRALDEYGYMPRSWDRLTEADRQVKARAVQELIDAGLILAMPDCSHPSSTLVRREVRLCDSCGLPVTLLQAVAGEVHL